MHTFCLSLYIALQVQIQETVCLALEGDQSDGFICGNKPFDESSIQQGIDYKIVQHLFLPIQLGVYTLLIEVEGQYSDSFLFPQVIQELHAGFEQLINSVKAYAAEIVLRPQRKSAEEAARNDAFLGAGSSERLYQSELERFNKAMKQAKKIGGLALKRNG